ncbi:MAG: hypothetical protein ACXVZL_10700 [Gaiellaceae bacterium]
MGTSRRRARTLAVAVLAGAAVGVLGIAQAHALGPGPGGGASVHFVLGPGGPAVSRVDVTLRRPAKIVSIRLAGGGWIRCSPHGLRAACPLAGRTLDLAHLTRVAVVATR